MRARRALLYMPGDDLRKIRKGTTLGVDCICMDMEDGVAPARKTAARALIKEALQTLDFGRSERLVRINAIGSGLEREDLAAALSGRPDGVVLPKVETPDQIEWAEEQLLSAERENGWFPGRIGLIAIVETARGIVNLGSIAACGRCLQALCFGAEDLAGDVGMIRSREGREIAYARSAVVLHAAAYDLQAIDMVFVDLQDTGSLIQEAREAAAMGFAGKQIIHPNQVAPVQAAFTPDEETVAQARRIIQAAGQQQEQGLGVFALDGKMVEAPMVKAARRVIARAQAAGLVNGTDQELDPPGKA